MDKSEVIKAAPAYYLAALAIAIRELNSYAPEDDVRAFFEGSVGNQPRYRLAKSRLWDVTVDALKKRGALEVETDPFGPTLFRRGAHLDEVVSELEEDLAGPYVRSGRAPDPKSWMRAALGNLHETMQRSNVRDGDFGTPPHYEIVPKRRPAGLWETHSRSFPRKWKAIGQQSRQLVIVAFVYLIAIGSVVVTLGAAFADN
jgi:hypothetical protein